MKIGWWRRLKVRARRVRSALRAAGELLLSAPMRAALLVLAELLIALNLTSRGTAMTALDTTFLAATIATLGRPRRQAGPLVVMG